MRIGGIASGLDTHQIIDDLMRAEKIPLDRLFQRRQWVEWQRDAYRDVNLTISKFRDTHEKLRLQSSFNAFGSTSTLGNIATAATTSNAVIGSYSVDVTEVAKVAKLTSIDSIKYQGGTETVTSSTNIFEAMGTGGPATGETIEFKIKVGPEGNQLEKSIRVTENDTFSSLATKISQAAHDLEDENKGNTLGLRASFDNTTGRFFISSRETGADQTIAFEDSAFVQDYIIGGDPSSSPDSNITHDTVNGSYTVTGADAQFTFDGIDITSKTNTVRVHGLDITVKDVGTTTITVNNDADKVIENIKDFVNSYNELIADLQAQLNEPRYRSFPALTDEQRREMSDKDIELWEEKAKSGLLRNDGLVREILGDLRRSLSDPVKGIPNGEINMLSQIGITTSKDWRLGGKLELDEDKLRQALTEKPDEVRNLFTQRVSAGEIGANERESDYQGIGFRIQSNLNDTITKLRSKAGMPGSTASTDQSNLGKQLTRFDDQISRFERRLAMVEDRYWRQFTAMEKAMAEMNSQSAWMMQAMFGGMNQ